MRSVLSTVYSLGIFLLSHTSLRPHAQLPLTREKCRLWWLIEYEHEQIKEISCSPGIMAAFRDLILGARIGSETRRDPKRKTMIAFAAAFAVCTATMTSGTTAAFARGGGSFGEGTHGFGGGGFGGHGFAMGRGDIAGNKWGQLSISAYTLPTKCASTAHAFGQAPTDSFEPL
jgi:hypothetical protein